jgi:hypothetical protein
MLNVSVWFDVACKAMRPEISESLSIHSKFCAKNVTFQFTMHVEVGKSGMKLGRRTDKHGTTMSTSSKANTVYFQR